MKFAILQSTILEYRLGFYRSLRKKYGTALTICAGVSNTDPNQKTPDSAWEYTNRVKNRYFFSGRLILLWQSGVFRLLKDQPLVIVDANLRFISTIMLVFYRYCKGLPTVAWGHAEGSSNLGKWLRKYYFKFFSGLIAYTESQKLYFQKKYPNISAWSAFNACLGEEDCYAPDVDIQKYTDFIFVGRLSEQKKPELLFDAFIKASKSLGLPEESRLIFIGEGAIRSRLMDRAVELGLTKRIVFTGAIHETNLLRQHYRRAIAAVSPGCAGLSVTQACSFGVPMLIAHGEPHGPEIEVCREGFNSRFFAFNNPSELADLLVQFYNERELWFSRRRQIAEDTRARYSFEKMSKTFIDVVTHFSSQA